MPVPWPAFKAGGIKQRCLDAHELLVDRIDRGPISARERLGRALDAGSGRLRETRERRLRNRKIG